MLKVITNGGAKKNPRLAETEDCLVKAICRQQRATRVLSALLNTAYVDDSIGYDMTSIDEMSILIDLAAEKLCATNREINALVRKKTLVQKITAAG